MSGLVSRKRKPTEGDDLENPQQLTKRRKFNEDEKDVSGDEFPSDQQALQAKVICLGSEVVSTTTASEENLPKNTLGSRLKLLESKRSVKTSSSFKSELQGKDNRVTLKIITGQGKRKPQAVLEKEIDPIVSKGNVAIKSKKSEMKSSTVISVCQKGGILKSFQLSKHPILMGDVKMERAQQTESFFQQRYVCPYCTLTDESADPIRKHVLEVHKNCDPTVIDRLSYVRKQRCKTFYCWNPECDYQTSVCEERESHMETTRCGDIYERKFGEPAPRVKERRNPFPKKSSNEVSEKQSAASHTIKSEEVEETQVSDALPVVKRTRRGSRHGMSDERNGGMDENKVEQIKEHILKLFNEEKSQSLDRADILESLDDCSEEELSHVLSQMAEDNVVVYSGSIVFLV